MDRFPPLLIPLLHRYLLHLQPPLQGYQMNLGHTKQGLPLYLPWSFELPVLEEDEPCEQCRCTSTWAAGDTRLDGEQRHLRSSRLLVYTNAISRFLIINIIKNLDIAPLLSLGNEISDHRYCIHSTVDRKLNEIIKGLNVEVHDIHTHPASQVVNRQCQYSLIVHHAIPGHNLPENFHLGSNSMGEDEEYTHMNS